MLGTTELVLILIIVVVIFGASRLPQLGRGIGEALRNFKKAVGSQDEIDVTPRKTDDDKEPKDEGKKG